MIHASVKIYIYINKQINKDDILPVLLRLKLLLGKKGFLTLPSSAGCFQGLE